MKRNLKKAFIRSIKLLNAGCFPYNILSSFDYYGAMKISDSHIGYLPDGVKVAIPPNNFASFLGSIDDVYVDKEYELLNDFKPSKSDVVVDAGASTGVYALKCGSMVGEKGKVYAIEPLPLSYVVLLNNVLISKLKNIIPINVALLNSEGYSWFYSCKAFPSVTSISEKHVKAARGQNYKQLKVKTSTLDSIIAKYQVKNIDLLKIDVEGAELNVLAGAAEALDRGNVDRIIIEVHEYVVNLKEVVAFLHDKSYKVAGIFACPYQKKMLYSKLKR
ncbi:MAG: FkbM family methyltransferase [Candidatus Bathyarchaeia archaeon]|jgi:FkbM family methyltransferase